MPHFRVSGNPAPLAQAVDGKERAGELSTRFRTSSRLERFSIKWNHSIGNESLRFIELEHGLIEKVDQEPILRSGRPGPTEANTMSTQTYLMIGSGLTARPIEAQNLTGLETAAPSSIW